MPVESITISRAIGVIWLVTLGGIDYGYYELNLRISQVRKSGKTDLIQSLCTYNPFPPLPPQIHTFWLTKMKVDSFISHNCFENISIFYLSLSNSVTKKIFFGKNISERNLPLMLPLKLRLWKRPKLQPVTVVFITFYNPPNGKMVRTATFRAMAEIVTGIIYE
jgi:hypothetical protein